MIWFNTIWYDISWYDIWCLLKIILIMTTTIMYPYIYIYMYKYHHVFVLFKGRSYPIMTLERHNGCSNNWRSRHGVNPLAHLQFDSECFGVLIQGWCWEKLPQAQLFDPIWMQVWVNNGQYTRKKLSRSHPHPNGVTIWLDNSNDYCHDLNHRMG